MINRDAKLKSWFSRRIEENMGGLYAMAKRLTRDDTIAEDLVADAVTRAWTSLDQLQHRTRFRAWIFCILRNIFFDQARRNRARPDEIQYEENTRETAGHEVASLLIEQPDDFLSWWANPEQNFINSLLCEDVMNAIDRLPPAYREAVYLVNVEGFSYDEAADALAVSPGTIRSRMNRGRTLMQKYLWQHARDAGLIDTDFRTELKP